MNANLRKKKVNFYYSGFQSYPPTPLLRRGKGGHKIEKCYKLNKETQKSIWVSFFYPTYSATFLKNQIYGNLPKVFGNKKL